LSLKGDGWGGGGQPKPRSAINKKARVMGHLDLG